MTTEPITDDELAELERLCDVATPGPWEAAAAGAYYEEGKAMEPPEYFVRQVGGDVAIAEMADTLADARFLAASRTAMPHLLTDLRQARAELGRLRAAVDIAERGWNNQVRYSDAYQKRAEQAEAEVARLTTAVEQARELLAELLDETGLKACYTLADGGLHPGATSTVAAVWRFLWPAPATATKETQP